jgi:hypothetical protein
MKQFYFLLAIIIYISPACAQEYDNIVSFETNSSAHNQFVRIDPSYANNKFQIGSPAKSNFSTAINGNKAIVTDLTSHCSAGDTSVFYLYFPIGVMHHIVPASLHDLNFKHKLDIDSGSKASIDILRTNSTGNIWVNLTDTPFLYNQWWLGLDTIFFDRPTPTGQHVDVKINTFSLNSQLNMAGYTHPLGDTNHVFRFMYISNDTSNTKDGWMIDDIYGFYLGLGIDDVNLSTINIYPNPSNGQLSIQTNDLRNPKVEVYDCMGKLVHIIPALPADGNISMKLPDGVYYLRCSADDKYVGKKLIIKN